MLSEFFHNNRIKLDLESRTKDGVLVELVEIITGSCSDYNKQELLEAVASREGKMTTIIMPGIAVPHGYCNTVRGIIGAIGFSREGIEFDESDTSPVHLFFILVMDESSRELNLKVFTRILEMLHSTDLNQISGMASPQELYDLLCRF